MRIISGRFKSRKIIFPKLSKIRPTSDKVKEAIFNILFHRFNFSNSLEGVKVLDLFAGTGSLSLEALSRGASYATMIENDSFAYINLKKNISALGLDNLASLINADILSMEYNIISHDLCFIDAPYYSNYTPKVLIKALKSNWIKKGSLVICELARDEDFDIPDNFINLLFKDYGKTRIYFLNIKP